MSGPRILHCIPTLCGGGAERQLVYLSRELCSLGWDVHIAAAGDGPNAGLLSGSGVTLHHLAATRKYDPRILSQLVALVWRVQPDIIQTWHPKMDILGGLAALLLARRWIIAERSSWEAQPDRLRYRVRKYLARRSDGVIANSACGADYWGGITARRVIRNSVPFDSIDSAAPVEDLPETAGRRVILFVGRFYPEKNPIGAVEALAHATDSGDAVAVMLGDGPLRGDVDKAIRRFGATGRILPLGYSEEAWSWMKRADVLLSLSEFEGQPNAVLEAMTAGCSLVLSDIPAHRELVDESSAYFVDRKDPIEAGRKIREVIATNADKRLKVTNGPARRAAHSVHEIASQYHSEYLRILDGVPDSGTQSSRTLGPGPIRKRS